MWQKVISFCLISLLVPIAVKGQDKSVEKELYQPTDVPSKSPINVELLKVEIIKTATPLQRYQGFFDKFNVTNKGNIIEAYPMPDDHSFITGGILGERKYKLAKLRFYITQSPIGRSGNTIAGLGGPLEPTEIYHNVLYPTLEEALKHPDGVVQLGYCVLPSLIFEPKFYPFQKTLGKIKEAGSSSPQLGIFTSIWYNRILLFEIYLTYRGSYTDIDTGKQHYGATYIIASPQMFGFSFKQFKAFQNLKGKDGKPLEAAARIYEQGNRTVFLATGVVQKFTFNKKHSRL